MSEIDPAKHAVSRSDADWLEFSLLAMQWKQETVQSSSLRKVYESKYYKKILEMGPRVVPLIIRQLISEGSNPYHWFAALMTLTKENPVPKTSSVRDISSAWIDWGRARYGRQLGPSMPVAFVEINSIGC
jgi:hypothetical protein